MQRDSLPKLVPRDHALELLLLTAGLFPDNELVDETLFQQMACPISGPRLLKTVLLAMRAALEPGKPAVPLLALETHLPVFLAYNKNAGGFTHSPQPEWISFRAVFFGRMVRLFRCPAMCPLLKFMKRDLPCPWAQVPLLASFSALQEEPFSSPALEMIHLYCLPNFPYKRGLNLFDIIKLLTNDEIAQAFGMALRSTKNLPLVENILKTNG